MIVAVLLESKTGEFISLTVDGHAESAAEGHDLVCASISGIVLGGVSALKDGDDRYDFEEKKGHVSLLRRSGSVSVHDATVLETVVTQIQSVASAYPRNVKLERKIKP